MTVRREVLLWLEAAREDLEDAEIAIERRRWFRAAFFAQQAVEKALKALYPLVLRREPPKIHTVTELYKELRRGGFKLPPRLEEALYVFNKYYTVTRYPDAANGPPSESVDREEALRAYRLAVEVVRAVETTVEEGA